MNRQIGIIGAGNIGGAIARGLVRHGDVPAGQILLSRKREELLSDFEGQGFRIADNETIVGQCDIIILSVLPGQAEAVIRSLAGSLDAERHILASIVSAVSIREIRGWIGNNTPVVRFMANTAVEYGASMTCIAGEDEQANEAIRKLFDSLGKTMIIPEQLMPAATILAACGIAFFLRFIRAVSQGGIQIGFHADEAGFIAAQTALGAARLLMHTKNHPETEIDRVTTPMGCTISGLNEMEHYGLSSAMIKGIIRSFEGISELK
ncbi:MAG: NAD(P)-binding domain-containing protein [Bacteroidales bacterium]|nr:NAD(P)-binding domain-containing protein [Bacteroidales bacterium]MBN2697612.1 NAD(P)-binding domain-containing protein [Bacteroidales bacterium]